ncbi:alpha/beta-Hydrolases protein [Dioscorea alata]|uniref:Alpha/beta-Hydrolases protein n=2 Tax=Dioscorea alata TaxID=55571 RepID=A0ACB7V6Z8_DIOAL|nr:alpha/beta-Hydrolases protein [Dioscorea alata]KAH7669221.1 alpha/beta-Hydrolases protein [Dioscorea alata]
MASFSTTLHRPLSAIAAVAVAAVSTDLPERFPGPKTAEPQPSPSPSVGFSASPSWLPRISISNLTRTSFPVLIAPYQYAKLAKPAKPQEIGPAIRSSPGDDVMYQWHLPSPSVGESECSLAKSQTVVVLLGWLGAKQKHLNKYAEWYTARGFHAITFTFPMGDIIGYKVGGKVEQNLDLFAEHLAGCVAEEDGKNLVFHTFSNTGWLTYGVLLEKFRKDDPSLMEKIKGCIVDSAPVAAPDPQVWASGFSAAFLKKQSVATKGGLVSNGAGLSMMVHSNSKFDQKPALAETALLAILERFFGVVLNIPSINRRLSDVLEVLSSEQPKCPQLYIYSSADRVIPAKSVETFIERQRKAGHVVRACDFVSSPHVDHFRNHPVLYATQLTTFLNDCVITCCKNST